MNELEFAVDLAKKAGVIMKENYGAAAELKDNGTLLTEADTAINQLVIDEVKKAFPKHGVVGEEQSLEGSSTFTWVCDPIDGTAPFRYEIPISTFSLALVENGVPILGVVNDVFSGRLYIGEKGKGATMNGTPIHVNNYNDLVGGGINFQISTLWDTDHQMRIMKYLHENKVHPMKIESTAFSGVRLAEGKIACLIFPSPYPWDVAALKVIIEEAGGTCTDLHGNDQRYDRDTKGFVATNGVLHDEILKIIEEKK